MARRLHIKANTCIVKSSGQAFKKSIQQIAEGLKEPNRKSIAELLSG